MRKRIEKMLALALAVGMFGTLPGMQVLAEEISAAQPEIEIAEEEIAEEEIPEEIPEENAEEETLNEETIEADAEEEIPEDTAEENVEKAESETAEVPDVSTFALSATLFDDVREDAWYFPYVGYVLNKGIMTGKGNSMFVPGEELARAQFATVLWRLSGSPDVGYSPLFPDVNDGSFYTKAVLWASSEDVGVVTGYENGEFGPADWITREQMATMLYRYAQYRQFAEVEPADLAAFPDAGDVNDFAADAMRWAVGAGIITGDNGCLNPLGNTNRAECAAMLYRFCEKYMPGELQDIEISASCDSVSVSLNGGTGEFWMKVNGVSASSGIAGVQAKAWCYDDKSDIGLYNLYLQQDGTYGASGAPRYHGYRAGTYKVQMYALLDIGVRIPIGDVQTVVLAETTGYYQIMDCVKNVYNQVGYDLNACYWWTVNSLYYQSLPIPLNPPSGYSRAENYALYGFRNGCGNCYVYAAVFYYLAKGLGYNAEFIEGQVGLASGGYGPHGWVMIYQNDGAYICDPEAQYEIGGYNFYMQPAYSPVLRYAW